jgi:hypothetical protein
LGAPVFGVCADAREGEVMTDYIDGEFTQEQLDRLRLFANRLNVWPSPPDNPDDVARLKAENAALRQALQAIAETAQVVLRVYAPVIDDTETGS